MMLRLDKFLSSQLNRTRSEVKKLIAGKRVRLDPVRPARADTQIDPARDRVFVDGNEIVYKAHRYLMLNKPAGYVSSTEDRGPTVLDLVPEELMRAGLFPAGRLDKDTTGFVFLTDDGVFAHEILSPAKHVRKTYLVTLERPVTVEERRLLTGGMVLDGKRLKPAGLTEEDAARNLYRITLTEGRYHQIKRMFLAVGNRVTALHRIGIGDLLLDEELEPGACRELTEEEVRKIKEIRDV